MQQITLEKLQLVLTTGKIEVNQKFEGGDCTQYYCYYNTVILCTNTEVCASELCVIILLWWVSFNEKNCVYKSPIHEYIYPYN